MKGSSNIVSGIHHLKITDEHFASFQREHPHSKGAKLFNLYRTKINWILNDLLTHPFLTDDVREGIRKELASDVFTPSAIGERAALLPPQQRERVELLIEELLSGKEINVVQEELI